MVRQSPRYTALLSAQHQLKAVAETLEGVEAQLCQEAVGLAVQVNTLLIAERRRLEDEAARREREVSDAMPEHLQRIVADLRLFNHHEAADAMERLHTQAAAYRMATMKYRLLTLRVHETSDSIAAELSDSLWEATKEEVL
jgi:hypothetical protein